ncbi:MAG: hypothetical protein K2L89_04265 [Muribaculaceae bacterium]|nr:hypothetical protein [Muribaculaceae bacterium]
MDRLNENEVMIKNRKLFLFVSICMIAAFIIRLIEVEIHDYTKLTLQSFNMSEFLINYQGGFVRRGLFGEGLYHLYTLLGFPLRPTIMVFSLTVYLLVLGFFIYQFREHKYCWWLILSPLFMGMQEFIIRKDYLLYAVLIGILYLLRKEASLRNVLACLILVISIMVHEAFFLWCIPIYTLLLWSEKRKRVLNFFLIVIPVFAFLLMSYFKGSPAVADAINDSWNAIVPGQPLLYDGQSSIGALGWNTLETFKWHLSVNAGEGGAGVVLVPLIVLGAYYLFTNFMYAFRKASEEEKRKSRLALSLVYSVTFIFLIPMFTFLSCDVGRVMQYLVVVTISSFLIIPSDRLISIFPTWYVNGIKRVNSHLISFLPPNKGVLILLLLFLSIRGCMFSVLSCWTCSVVGTLWHGPIRLFHLFIM